MRVGIPSDLERRIRALARQMDVSPAKVVEIALRLGLDRDKIAEALCDEAFEPLRQCAKRHKGKSLGEVVRRRKRG